MPRPKPINFNPPADLLEKLPKASVTRGEKLKALEEMTHRQPLEWRERHAKVLRAIDADIRAAGRTQRDSAPVVAEAPSKAEKRTEQGSSIPPKALERKISEDITVAIGGSAEQSINLYTHGQFLICFTPDQAERAAQALAELADDLRQDVIARAWSQDLLAATTG